MRKITLLARCADRTGIVAALSDFVFRNDGNIVSLDQFADADTGVFSIRMQWDLSQSPLDASGIRAGLSVITQRYGMQHELYKEEAEQRVAVFCSTTPHCLYDLLLRQELGEYPGRIVQVVSNHENLRAAAEHFAVPFLHIPVAAGGKAATERQQLQLLQDQGIDLVVLARYMQVLSPDFVAAWRGRCINIHHSFLPAFAGARPYHQAKVRGVKVIGATAHYVTEDLDEGPIIEQDVVRVSHHDQVSDLVRKGRDLERQVLARAVGLHLEHRIIVDGNRTVIFR